MSLFSRIRTAFKFATPLSDMERDMIAKVIPGYTAKGIDRGVTGMLKAYSRSPWVRAVEGKIADATSSTRWLLFGYRNASGKFIKRPDLQQKNVSRKSVNVGDYEGELVPIYDHPMLRLLNSANPLFPGSVGRKQTQISIDLTGEGYWILIPNSFEEGAQIVPEQFWFLPSTWVTEMPSATEPTWKVETPYWTGRIPAPFILRFVTPDPLNPYGRGSGIFRAFGDEIDTDEYASKHVRNFFLNGARPDLLIFGENLNPADTKRVEIEWTQSLRGFWNRHKPFFLGRKVEVRELGQKFSDMGMNDLRKWERDIIINGIGAPPELFGIVENSNRATIESADYLWARWVITPRLDLIRSTLQWGLVPLYDDRLIVGYESPVQEDREFQLNVMKARPSAFTVNDWRDMASHEPADDGDVYIMAFNEKIVADLTPTALPEPMGLSAQATETKALASPEAKALPAPVLKQVGGPETTRLALNLSPQMEKEIAAAFKAISNQIDYRALMAAFDSGDIERALAVIAEADLPAELEYARQTIREAIVVVGESAATELGDFLGTTIAFDLNNPESIAFLEEAGAEMVSNVSEETMTALRDLLAQAYREGKTSQEVAKLIEKHIGLTARDIKTRERLIREMENAGLSQAEIEAEIDKWTAKKIKYRAKTIADNELTKAGNQGQRRLWDQAAEDGLIGKETLRQWIVTPDDALCQLCSPMGAAEPGISIVPLNLPYETPTGPVMIPSDIHVRCRCTERLLV